MLSVSNTRADESAPDYAGSIACEGCHTYIYENWQSTRHGASIMTGEKARRAGYPLPVAHRGGQSPSIRTWQDVAYVIGRRKRVAYIDHTGTVQDSSYHQRLNRWEPFPSKKMWVCGSCHFTGFPSGQASYTDLPTAKWGEMAIGCEACHGPGGRHVETLSRDDISLDASQRVCGNCHTTIGKVLPVDDRQDMHEFVQVWNQDAHATGTQQHSYTAFCARCHAPFQGHFADTPEKTGRRVFTEHKQAIGCIGCHNPHEQTNRRYTEARITLQPAVLPRLHTYRGNDGDFTTTDFEEHSTVEEVCLQCHRGADRVDLNHANAQCIDCHNGYNRNRTPETRIFHDANRRELSCQPCHRNADHLMSILFQDPEFLAPKHIHNLRTLPAAVKQKHGLRFTELSYPSGPREVTSTDEGGYEIEAVVEDPATPALESPPPASEAETGQVSELLASARALLEQGRTVQAHRELQRVLANEPENPVAHDLLGRSYLSRGDAERAVTAFRASLESRPDSLETWFQYARSIRSTGDAATAIQIYGEILARKPDHFDSRFELAGLLKFSADSTAYHHQNKSESARPANVTSSVWEKYLATLQRASANYSQLALSEYALALSIRPGDHGSIHQVSDIYRRTGRLDLALRYFGWLSSREPENWLHVYRLGTVLIELERYEEAIEALESAVELAPTEGDTYFALGLALTRASHLTQALKIFQQGTVYEPFNPALYTNLGAAAGQLGHYQRARTALQRSLELASFPLPRVHLSYTNLALVHLAEGRRDEAITALKSALHAYPDYAHARTLLARVTSPGQPGQARDSDEHAFVFNDFLQRFGEITTVAFDDE